MTVSHFFQCHSVSIGFDFIGTVVRRDDWCLEFFCKDCRWADLRTTTDHLFFVSVKLLIAKVDNHLGSRLWVLAEWMLVKHKLSVNGITKWPVEDLGVTVGTFVFGKNYWRETIFWFTAHYIVFTTEHLIIFITIWKLLHPNKKVGTFFLFLPFSFVFVFSPSIFFHIPHSFSFFFLFYR